METLLCLVKNAIASANLLANGKTLSTKSTEDVIVIDIPANAPDKIASVIKLIVKGKVDEQIK